MSAEKGNSGLPKPTERELEIVRVLWDQGPSTVREVVNELNANRKPPLAYTTVLRFFQIMLEKGLVTRTDGQKGHVYQTSVPAEKTKRQLAQDLIQRAFAGSARELVLHALGGRDVSPEELAEIKKLIRKIEREEGKHE
ncbi:MAG: BlaI/MecI/CopY family transcriptional regulator [Verrucomicrobiota bacterium]